MLMDDTARQADTVQPWGCGGSLHRCSDSHLDSRKLDGYQDIRPCLLVMAVVLLLLFLLLLLLHVQRSQAVVTAAVVNRPI